MLRRKATERGSRPRRGAVSGSANGSVASPIELHLPDGGRLVLTFDLAGPDCAELEDTILAAVIFGNGTEQEIAEEIRDSATSVGLRAAISVGNHPTVVMVRR